MKTIYISHPYTGDEKKNRREARAIAAMLARECKCIIFINPLDALRHTVVAGLSYENIMMQALTLMLRCDGVIMAGDWEKSQGCMREYNAALAHKKRVWESVSGFLRAMGVPGK